MKILVILFLGLNLYANFYDDLLEYKKDTTTKVKLKVINEKKSFTYKCENNLVGFTKRTNRQYQSVASLTDKKNSFTLYGGRFTNGRNKGSGYDGNAIESSSSCNYLNSKIMVKFKVNGERKYSSFTLKPSSFKGSVRYTTNNTWAGSFLIPEKTYLFQTISFNKNGKWNLSLSKYNYTNRQGSNEIFSKEGELSEEERKKLKNDKLIFVFGDNYAGTRTWLEIKEVIVQHDNINSISNFSRKNKNLLIEQTWKEFDLIKSNNSNLKKDTILEKALSIALNKQKIRIKSSTFLKKEDSYEIPFNDLGTYSFKIKNISNKLSKDYILRNTKFKIIDNTVKIIAADLYPTTSGNILSHGRIVPMYKYTPNNILKRKKLNKKEKKKFRKAYKMALAGMEEDAYLIYDFLAEKNPIGLALSISQTKKFHYQSHVKVQPYFIKGFKELKKINLDIKFDDTNDIKKEGVLVTKILNKNTVLETDDIILAIDGQIIKRKNDINEVLNNLESTNNLEIEVIRNSINQKLNIEVNNIVRYQKKLFKNYTEYILNAQGTKNVSLAKIAYEELNDYVNRGFILLDVIEKEKLLLLEALVLSSNEQDDKAIKKLFSYPNEFKKESIDFLMKNTHKGWAPLLKNKKKLAILFEVPTSSFKKLKKLVHLDFCDLNANIIKTQIEKKQIKKKLQINSQKGGVLE